MILVTTIMEKQKSELADALLVSVNKVRWALLLENSSLLHPHTIIFGETSLWYSLTGLRSYY